VRSVVDRACEGHRRLVDELVGLKRTLAEEEAAIEAALGGSGPPPPTPRGGKKFEMWISLKVGLPEEGPAAEPSFPGQKVFAVRTMSLKRQGTHLRRFFSDHANVDVGRDADGTYLVPRSYKHFGAICEFLRDGSCALPVAYVPSTYDNRPASSEEAELLEFAREAAFYGLRELLELAVPKLLGARYGGNARMLELLRAKSLLA